MAFFSEHCGTFSRVKEYRKKNDSVIGGHYQGDDILEVVQLGETGSSTRSKTKSFFGVKFRVPSNSWWSSWNLMLTFRKIFLPCGFPDSVSSDYVEYQIYDTIQAFSSSITGALATEAVFKSVGVGSTEASPLAAALTWLIKSGSGMVSGIVFTWSKGTALDYDNKKWRLFADVLNDSAIFLDLITPLFPSNLVIFMFSLSSIARALVGVAGGATRAAITQHQARRQNAADVSAKDASQETLVNLVSLIVSLILLPIVSGHTIVVWALFVFFTFLHVFANYRALRALNLEVFNTSRLLFALQRFLLYHKVPTVYETNQNESIIVGFGIKDREVSGFSIRVGVSLEEAVPSLSTTQINAAIQDSEGKPFLIIPNIQAKVISIVLAENILSASILEGYSRAVLAAHRFNAHMEVSVNPNSPGATKAWEAFLHGSTSEGFDLSSALIQTNDWRAKWKHS